MIIKEFHPTYKFEAHIFGLNSEVYEIYHPAPICASSPGEALRAAHRFAINHLIEEYRVVIFQRISSHVKDKVFQKEFALDLDLLFGSKNEQSKVTILAY